MGMIDGLLNTTVTVRRLAATKDASRGPVAAWPSVLDGWPAHVSDTGRAQTFANGQEAIVNTFRVTMNDPGDLGTPARALGNGDVIDEDGRYYRVTNVDRRKELFSGEVYLSVDCEEYAP